MRDYGIVSPRFWIGETGKKLRGNPVAQLVACYLVTGPHANMIGVYHLPVLYIAHETGSPLKGASKALRTLIEARFCEYDEQTETVFVLNMAAWQIGDALKATDRRVEGVRREVEKIASARLKARFLQVYGKAFCLTNGDDIPSPFEAPSEPHRSQDQDQDQDQKKGYLATESPTPNVSRGTDPEYPPEFLDLKLAYPARAGDAKWRSALKAARARLREGHTWAEMIDGAKRYEKFLRATGKLGTEYVKTAATFVGPDKPFLEFWTPPVKPTNGNGREPARDPDVDLRAFARSVGLTEKPGESVEAYTARVHAWNRNRLDKLQGEAA